MTVTFLNSFKIDDTIPGVCSYLSISVGVFIQ